MDGEVTQRFSFSLRFEPRVSMKSFYFKDIKIDNNARGSTPPPENDRFKFEGSATISFAGGLASSYIDTITYDSVVIEDPAADGFNHSVSGTIGNITYINPIERGRTRTRSSIQEYYRAKNVTIINPQVHSIETESVSSPPHQANITVIGGSSKFIDLTTVAYNDSVRIDLNDHINTEKFNCSGMRNININGGQIKINKDFPRIENVPQFNADRTKILFNYDPVTGNLDYLRFFKSSGNKQKANFDKCKFLIDFDGPLPIAPNAALIANTAGSAISDASVFDQIITISNSEFDERAIGSINAYRMGTVVLKDNKYGGTVDAINWGTSSGSSTDLTIDGGDFTAVTGNALKVGGASSKHKLTLKGEWVGGDASKWATASGSISTYAPAIFNYRSIILDTLPTSALAKDVFKVGTAAATVGTVIEYQCVVSSATAPTFVCSKQLGLYAAVTASLPTLTLKEKWAKAHDTTTNTIKTWTGTAWI